MKLKICGISDSKTLEHLISHSNPPQYIGFIVNYLKSKRFVQLDKLKELFKDETLPVKNKISYSDLFSTDVCFEYLLKKKRQIEKTK